MKDGHRMNRRILHTSDLHLASSKDKGCRSLANLVQAAEETRVDLVLIAGDLFDSNAVDDHLVRFVVEQLQRLPARVVILPGNHDCLDQDSVFHREAFRDHQPNIQVLRTPKGEIRHFPDLGISIWGKPIGSGNLRPLDGIPPPEHYGHWHVAVAHGYYVDHRPPLFPSYHITHEEIVNSGWDYIALGHVPTFQCVCEAPVKACYCGSPSTAGTVAIVDLAEETGIRATRYSV